MCKKYVRASRYETSTWRPSDGDQYLGPTNTSYSPFKRPSDPELNLNPEINLNLNR